MGYLLYVRLKEMNFYWFGRPKEDDLSLISKELEDAGFFGMLLPYEVNLGDYFVKIAKSINKDEKIKYVVAIRPYTISPQYLVSIIKSLNNIDPDRVWVNFVSGQILDKEKVTGGIFGDTNDTSSIDKRRDYLKEYVPVFKRICKQNNVKTKICISGTDDSIFSLTERFGDYNFAAAESYFKNVKLKDLSKPRVLSMCPFIRKTEEEVEELKDSKNITPDITPTTENNLISIIKKMKHDGINDVMFYDYGILEERKRIIDFVKNNQNIFL